MFAYCVLSDSSKILPDLRSIAGTHGVDLMCHSKRRIMQSADLR